jgi:hypothetical protein
MSRAEKPLSSSAAAVPGQDYPGASARCVRESAALVSVATRRSLISAHAPEAAPVSQHDADDDAALGANARRRPRDCAPHVAAFDGLAAGQAAITHALDGIGGDCGGDHGHQIDGATAMSTPSPRWQRASVQGATRPGSGFRRGGASPSFIAPVKPSKPPTGGISPKRPGAVAQACAAGLGRFPQ